MPMPPPPATLFTRSGKPTAPAAPTAASTSTNGGVPGGRGTPAVAAAARASSFAPKRRICAGVGPMNTSPAASIAAAASASSARNP